MAKIIRNAPKYDFQYKIIDLTDNYYYPVTLYSMKEAVETVDEFRLLDNHKYLIYQEHYRQEHVNYA